MFLRVCDISRYKSQMEIEGKFCQNSRRHKLGRIIFNLSLSDDPKMKLFEEKLASDVNKLNFV